MRGCTARPGFPENVLYIALLLALSPTSQAAPDSSPATARLRKDVVAVEKEAASDISRRDWPAAERDLRKAVQMAAAGGRQSEIYATALHYLGVFLLKHGSASEAAAALSQALKAQESALWPEHPDAIDTRTALIEALGKTGKYKEAEQLALEQVKIQGNKL